MSQNLTKFLHGNPGDVADILSGDNPQPLDDHDVRAILTNLCLRVLADETHRAAVDNLREAALAGVTRLEQQIERIAERHNERLDNHAQRIRDVEARQ